MRGVLIPPGLPAALPRSQRFDALAMRIVADITAHVPQVADVEFAVEDVPPIDPAPWESASVTLGRYFPAERSRRTPSRIVLYRLPIQARCRGIDQLRDALAWVIVENVANALGMHPEDVVPPAWGRLPGA
nr:metallopeptidase family protein [Nanchangia anserum]